MLGRNRLPGIETLPPAILECRVIDIAQWNFLVYRLSTLKMRTQGFLRVVRKFVFFARRVKCCSLGPQYEGFSFFGVLLVGHFRCSNVGRSITFRRSTYGTLSAFYLWDTLYKFPANAGGCTLPILCASGRIFC